MDSVLKRAQRSQHCRQQDSRWILYDALPATDPVTMQSAVLLKTSDVTALTTTCGRNRDRETQSEKANKKQHLFLLTFSQILTLCNFSQVADSC